MKLPLLSAAALCTLFLFSGCEKFTEKKFDTTVTMEFEVDIADTDPLSFSMSDVINAASGDIEAYKDDIKSYRIKNFRYKVWEFYTDTPGEDVLMSGSLGLAKKTATAPGVSVALTDVSLLSANDNPDPVSLGITNSQKTKVESYLLSSNGLKIWLDGTTSSVPVHFKLQLILDLEVVADVKK